jgi:hypothetical protein
MVARFGTTTARAFPHTARAVAPSRRSYGRIAPVPVTPSSAPRRWCSVDPPTSKGGTVAIGIRGKFVGMDAEQFDKLEAGNGARDAVPDGLIFHASGPVDDGWGVLDFWETRAQFDSFLAQRVAPAAAALGITTIPEVHEFPVHEFLLGR